MLSCGNQLAGDPDFGQRKYCRVVYVCAGGKAQELRIEEGERATLKCSAELATTPTSQNSPAAGNRATGSSSSYSASGSDSRADLSNRATVNTSTPSSVGPGSPEFVELAGMVQDLEGNGGDAQRMAFATFAALQMRMIAPNDPGWNRSNPQWVTLFKTVQQDLERDLDLPLQARMADGLRWRAAAELGES